MLKSKRLARRFGAEAFRWIPNVQVKVVSGCLSSKQCFASCALQFALWRDIRALLQCNSPILRSAGSSHPAP
ncbi:hypothetical protein PC119_g5917 [Phytophthora cactorum]|uniref:Uncharacterized protein n=1 Tax=Phytophthora cactorum TaxID=29920 RepID=A0A8T1DW37_9STRA|nr:hypothetical protein PC117_g8085 [Phytophthora cactorum]KAG3031524.1 hypothetical protein PC119_g5917 [Phytophthora cactorum]